MATFFGRKFSDKPPAKPTPVSGHKIVSAGPAGFYLIGGWNPAVNDNSGSSDDHYVREVWKHNSSKQEWKQLSSSEHTVPVSLASHCAAFLSLKKLLVYGGSLSPLGIHGNSTKAYIYHTKIETWQEMACSGPAPPEICGHWFGQSSFMDSGTDNFYVGTSDLRTRTMFLHRLNVSTWTWEPLSSAYNSFARVREELIFHNETVYILGGSADFMDTCFDLKNILTFSLSQHTWSIVQTVEDPEYGIPPCRSFFCSILLGDFVYIYGGLSVEGIRTVVLKDLWKLNLTTMQWTKITGLELPERWFHSATLSPNGCMYVFGGCTTTDYNVGPRSNDVLEIWLGVRPLQELCWRVTMKSFGTFLKNCDEKELMKWGVPLEFRNRMQF